MGALATVWFQLALAITGEAAFALLLYMQVGTAESFFGHFFPLAAVILVVVFIAAARATHKPAATIGLLCAIIFLLIAEISPTTQLRISPEGLFGLGDVRWLGAQVIIGIGTYIVYRAVYAWRSEPDEVK